MRPRWQQWLALIVLLGCTSGATLAQDSWERWEQATGAGDVEAGVEIGQALLAEELATDRRVVLLNWMMKTIINEERLGLAETVSVSTVALLDAPLEIGQRASLLVRLGSVRVKQREFAEGQRLLESALEVRSELSVDDEVMAARNLGVALAQQGKLPEALEMMLDALRIQEEAGRVDGSLLKNLGALSIYLKRFDDAVTYTRRALEVTDPGNPQVPGLYSNLGAAYVELGDLEQALQALETGIAIADEQGRPNTATIGNLGYVQRELGLWQEAMATYQRMARLDRESGRTDRLGVGLKNIGDIHVHLGERDAAMASYEEAYDLYQELGLVPKLVELYPPMIDNLEALGRFERALALLREFKRVDDDLTSADATERLAALQADFDLEKQERELAEAREQGAQQALELERLEREQQRQRLVRQGMWLGIAALALIIGLLWRTVRLRGKANRLLEAKNAKISAQGESLSRLNEKLAYASLHDDLTGLGNRRFLSEFIEQDDRPLESWSLLLIDIDDFKLINDRFGHTTGDRALQWFASRLNHAAYDGDVVVRWGGEEFIWLTRAVDEAQLADACRRIGVELTREPLELDDLTVSCSVGAVPVGKHGESFAESFQGALRVADAALYEAKRAGRNRWLAVSMTSQPGSDAADFAGLVRSGIVRTIAQDPVVAATTVVAPEV